MKTLQMNIKTNYLHCTAEGQQYSCLFYENLVLYIVKPVDMATPRERQNMVFIDKWS